MAYSSRSLHAGAAQPSFADDAREKMREMRYGAQDLASRGMTAVGETASAAQDSGPGPGAVWAADDRDEELKRLRRLTAEQAKTIEILKKATAFVCPDRKGAAGVGR